MIREAQEIARAWVAENTREKLQLDLDEETAQPRKALADEPMESPELASDAILCILEYDLLPEQFAVLAAGPVEELLSDHGDDFIQRVEKRAAEDPKFNYLLGGVWRLSMSEDVWSRVQNARNAVW